MMRLPLPTPHPRRLRGGRPARPHAAALALAALLAPLLPLLAAPAAAQAPATVQLSLESAVEMAMEDSYRVRRLRLEIERTRSLLDAQRAGLRSRVFLDFSLPDFERISETKWNSTLMRNEIVREHSQLWQMDFSVEQPVILFGYPTNGSLSANNRVYRYTQFGEEDDDIRYYNRYFLRYRQPLFQPNLLKNNLEEAELDYDRSELAFQGDAISIVGDVARQYYDLVELAYQGVIYGDMVGNLERAAELAARRAAADPARSIDVSQVQVALSNAQAQLQEARGDYRLASARMRQRLGLGAEDSIAIDPALQVSPLEVDLARAIELGLTLRPQLRMLDIDRRRNLIALDETRGTNAFRMNVELTYGREMEDPALRRLLEEPSNSYTVSVTGRVPIWDWGARADRVRAQEAVVARTQLSIDETREQIELEVQNMVRNLEEYQQRAENLETTLELARDVSAQSLVQYAEGRITALDLLQSFERQEDTGENFLQAYLGFRQAILDLQGMTYFDFENQVPVLERFGIRSGS